ncbi:MAG TPA: hypothetical protein DEB39_03295 [Planctomycetaceae bacterium]|nr:hypothetical protein [Planctomycetaceae bacterium]
MWTVDIFIQSRYFIRFASQKVGGSLETPTSRFERDVRAFGAGKTENEEIAEERRLPSGTEFRSVWVMSGM